MKRLFILATAAIVALASCSKTQVVYTDAPEEIAFKTVAGAMTKATALQSGSLGVIAHQGVVEHFGNTNFAWDNANSVFTTDKYWPHDGTLDFTIYAPYKDGAGLVDEVLTIPSVTAADALYYGVERYMETDKATTVPVVLGHISAKINVTFNGNGIFDLTSWTITGVNKTGSVTVDYTDNDAPVVTTLADPVPTTGDLTYDAGTSDYFVLPGNQTSLTVNFKQGSINFDETIDLSTESAKWVANSAYTYAISVSAPDKIQFTATVADWDGPTTTPINK